MRYNFENSRSGILLDKKDSKISEGNSTRDPISVFSLLISLKPTVSSLWTPGRLHSWNTPLLKTKAKFLSLFWVCRNILKGKTYNFLGNKVDRPDRQVPTESAQKWCKDNGDIQFFEVSAKENTGIKEAFDAVARIVLKKSKEEET